MYVKEDVRVFTTLSNISHEFFFKKIVNSHWRRSGVFTVNFEHISNLVPVFLLLSLIMQLPTVLTDFAIKLHQRIRRCPKYTPGYNNLHFTRIWREKLDIGGPSSMPIIWEWNARTIKIIIDISNRLKLRARTFKVKLPLLKNI